MLNIWYILYKHTSTYFKTWYVCNFRALFQESLAISTSSFTASRRMSLESALVEAWPILPATRALPCYRGGRGEWSHWIPLDIIGFPDVNLSRVLYRHSFFAGANGSSVLVHTVSICLSHSVFDFWKALKWFDRLFPLWHWGTLYPGLVPRLNSYSSSNMHSYTDNIQLFCLVEPGPKLELHRLYTIEIAILWRHDSCSFQQGF